MSWLVKCCQGHLVGVVQEVIAIMFGMIFAQLEVFYKSCPEARHLAVGHALQMASTLGFSSESPARSDQNPETQGLAPPKEIRYNDLSGFGCRNCAPVVRDVNASLIRTSFQIRMRCSRIVE
jgi:hypothetical protein